MTPPDSGDKPLCIVCWLPATRGLPEDGGKLYWCDKHGPFYDKPDSGEREVAPYCPHGFRLGMTCPSCQVSISRYFAQRILAALEDIDTQEVRAIRDELRAAVERKGTP